METEEESDLPADTEVEPEDGPEVPDRAYCEEVEDWSSTSSEWEREVLALVNERRAEGGRCGSDDFEPGTPLTMSPELRCAARVHSLDMVENDYFSHEDLDGGDSADRAEDAGYTGWTSVGENIAWGYASPEEVMEGWMTSEGHCRNILDPSYRELGVGHVAAGQMWTQVFGAR